MRKLFMLCLLLTAGIVQSAVAETSPIGQWKTIDDESGQPKSIVRIYMDGNELKGQIVELLDPEKKGNLCDLCSGELQNKPIEGMVFLWGLTEDDGEWAGGNILDPANGKEYSAKLKLVNDGQSLEVRGFIGFSLLGRTQVWNRI